MAKDFQTSQGARLLLLAPAGLRHSGLRDHELQRAK